MNHFPLADGDPWGPGKAMTDAEYDAEIDACPEYGGSWKLPRRRNWIEDDQHPLNLFVMAAGFIVWASCGLLVYLLTGKRLK